MEVRPAVSDDREQIRAIARDTLQSSYSLSPAQIETILDEEFNDGSLGDLLDDTDTMVLVADGNVDGTERVYGFITVEIGPKATIRWLHVDPVARGGGIATALLDRVREDVPEKPVAASILEEAVEGGEFLESFGLEQTDHDEISIGEEEFAVTTFTEGERTEPTNEPTVDVPESVVVDGDDRPLDHENRIPGKEAPFFPIHRGADEEEAFGYFCSECGSTEIAADGLDRLECGNCGNVHRADEWDDAYI